MDDPHYFVRPAYDGVELVGARKLREVAAESFQRARLAPLRPLLRRVLLLGLLFGEVAHEIRVELRENLVAAPVYVYAELAQHGGGNPLALAQESEKYVLGADVVVVKLARLVRGERENFLDALGLLDVGRVFSARAFAHYALDFRARVFEVDAHFAQDVHRHPLPEFDYPEQYVFGADVVVPEILRLFARQRQHLLGSGCELLHCVFFLPPPVCMYNICGGFCL